MFLEGSPGDTWAFNRQQICGALCAQGYDQQSVQSVPPNKNIYIFMLLSLKLPAYNKRPVPSPHWLYVYPSKCEKSPLVGKKKFLFGKDFLNYPSRIMSQIGQGKKKNGSTDKNVQRLLDAGRESAKLWF